MKVLPRDLFIFHSHWFLQHFICKNMAKMPIFKGKEFVSPLHQHWHTPKLRVVFLSILWRFMLRDLFIFHSHWFIQHFIPKNMAKMPIFKGKEFVSPLQQHWHTPKLIVVFLSILWKVFPEGLFIFHSHWFLQHFIPTNMAKMPIFKGKLVFSPLQQHWHTPKLRVVFLSILWRFLPEGFVYISFTLVFTTFIPKNMAKMPIFKGN